MNTHTEEIDGEHAEEERSESVSKDKLEAGDGIETTTATESETDNHETVTRDGEEEEKKNRMLDIFRHGTETVMKVSVAEAIKTRGHAAEVMITAELTQMLTRKVWTPVHAHLLTYADRRRII